MSFPLNYIELHVDNHTLEVAENILANNQLSNYSKIERYLWIGNVITVNIV